MTRCLAALTSIQVKGKEGKGEKQSFSTCHLYHEQEQHCYMTVRFKRNSGILD